MPAPREHSGEYRRSRLNTRVERCFHRDEDCAWANMHQTGPLPPVACPVPAFIHGREPIRPQVGSVLYQRPRGTLFALLRFFFLLSYGLLPAFCVGALPGKTLLRGHAISSGRAVTRRDWLATRRASWKADWTRLASRHFSLSNAR